MDDRAHEKPCTIIHPKSALHYSTLQLDVLLQRLSVRAADNPTDPPGCTIIDCSSLLPDCSPPALYAIWVTPVKTPSVFSLTCVGEHIRKQLVEHGKVVMSIFNDTGGYGESGEALAAGTYIVMLKRIDVDKLRCVPVNLSSGEKTAVREYVAQYGSTTVEEKEE
jgi:hypothetical protein